MEYKVLKNIGANFKVGEVIHIEDDEEVILTGEYTYCAIEFLLDEGYLEEKKESMPKFRIGEKVKSGDLFYSTIECVTYNNAEKQFCYHLAGSLQNFTLEEDIEKPTNDEMGIYFKK